MKNETTPDNHEERKWRQAEKWERKNVLFLSFCPHFFASPGRGGAAFQGGQDGADWP
jgi:hypothetical protein